MSESTFVDPMVASSRLQQARFELKDGGDTETAWLVYRANAQVVEAIAKLVKRLEVEAS